MSQNEIARCLEVLKSYDLGESGLTVRSILGQMVAKHIEDLIDSDPIAVKKMVQKGPEALVEEAEELVLMESFNVDFGQHAFGYVKTKFAKFDKGLAEAA